MQVQPKDLRMVGKRDEEGESCRNRCEGIIVRSHQASAHLVTEGGDSVNSECSEK